MKRWGVGGGIKSKTFLVGWSDVTCEPKRIHMLYPEPARTRLTTHGQMICSAGIPQLHTESKSDGHKETGGDAHTHTHRMEEMRR